MKIIYTSLDSLLFILDEWGNATWVDTQRMIMREEHPQRLISSDNSLAAVALSV